MSEFGQFGSRRVLFTAFGIFFADLLITRIACLNDTGSKSVGFFFPLVDALGSGLLLGGANFADFGATLSKGFLATMNGGAETPLIGFARFLSISIPRCDISAVTFHTVVSAKGRVPLDVLVGILSGDGVSGIDVTVVGLQVLLLPNNKRDVKGAILNLGKLYEDRCFNGN